MVLGDLDSYMQKHETRSPTYTIHKNKLKMNKRPKYKSRHHKSHRGEHRQKNLTYPSRNIFTNMSPGTRDINGKNKQVGSHQNKNNVSFCMAEENSIKMKYAKK